MVKRRPRKTESKKKRRTRKTESKKKSSTPRSRGGSSPKLVEEDAWKHLLEEVSGSWTVQRLPHRSVDFLARPSSSTEDRWLRVQFAGSAAESRPKMKKYVNWKARNHKDYCGYLILGLDPKIPQCYSRHVTKTGPQSSEGVWELATVALQRGYEDLPLTTRKFVWDDVPNGNSTMVTELRMRQSFGDWVREEGGELVENEAAEGSPVDSLLLYSGRRLRVQEKTLWRTQRGNAPWYAKTVSGTGTSYTDTVDILVLHLRREDGNWKGAFLLPVGTVDGSKKTFRVEYKDWETEWYAGYFVSAEKMGAAIREYLENSGRTNVPSISAGDARPEKEKSAETLERLLE